METHGNSVRLGRSGGVSRVDLRGGFPKVENLSGWLRSVPITVSPP